MNVRTWLFRARSIDKEIAKYEEALQKAKDAATRITQNYEGDGAQSTKDPHKLDSIAVYSDLLREKTLELFKVKCEITEALFKLEDSRQRRVAFAYFAECEKLEKIAVDMHYSYRQVKRIKNRAVETLERVLECPPSSMI